MAEEVQVLQLEVEITKYARDMSTLVSATKKADTSLTALLATTNQVKKALASLGANVSIKITADASDLDSVETDIRALDGSTPDVTIITDNSDLLRADALIGEIDGSTPRCRGGR